jgi:hypothetical protein
MFMFPSSVIRIHCFMAKPSYLFYPRLVAYICHKCGNTLHCVSRNANSHLTCNFCGTRNQEVIMVLFLPCIEISKANVILHSYCALHEGCDIHNGQMFLGGRATMCISLQNKLFLIFSYYNNRYLNTDKKLMHVIIQHACKFKCAFKWPKAST